MSSEKQTPRSIKGARNLLGKMPVKENGGSQKRLGKPSDPNASLMPGKEEMKFE